MNFFLVRHGEAKSEIEDFDRPLSDTGKQDVEKVASYISKLRIRPDEIHHSGKLRAEQTARIIAKALSLSDRVKAVQGLAPNDDVHIAAETLCVEERALMLIGHLPFLSRLLSLLIMGDPERSLVNFQAGSIVCLYRDDSIKLPTPGNGWIIEWYLSPGVIS
ncbi:phosphohistidine phosphatase SixA [Desulfobacterota bacterium AH_259_B03_O07]|nr:phosphohistidine phosphatase SixA [Desulfobacterota bacterium AH_259_B03_O07]